MIVVAAAALLIGYAMGQTRAGSSAAGAAAASPDPATPALLATATRTAELIELAVLRTRVAQPPPTAVCAPPTATPTVVAPATATPTPVPPLAAGQPLPYAGNWTVTVTAASFLSSFGDLSAEGTFARVDLLVVNGEATPRAFPYAELVLRDAQGRPFAPSLLVAARNEAGFFSPFSPSLPTPGFVVFDVATDATAPFVLESTADPAFRVTVELARRG